MAVRSPTTAARGRSCRMWAPRPAELSPARGDGTPLALAPLVSDVEAGGGSAAPGDDGATVALGLQFTYREIGKYVEQYRIFSIGFPYKQYRL
jgi:hypothetical protein